MTIVNTHSLNAMTHAPDFLLCLVLLAMLSASSVRAAETPALDLSLPAESLSELSTAPAEPTPAPPARAGRFRAGMAGELPYGAGYEARRGMGRGAGQSGWQGGGRGRRGGR